MNPVKVKNTISVNGIDCVKGKLILVWGDCRDEQFYKWGIESHDKTQFAKPIIISETEEIEIGDKCYDAVMKFGIETSSSGTPVSWSSVKKIIALPENFSKIDFLNLKNGLLRDGETVLVECEGFFHRKEEWDGEMGGDYIKNVKLDKNGYIHIEKSDEGWESLAYRFAIWSAGKEVPTDAIKMNAWFMEFVNEEANRKYNSPTKKIAMKKILF